MDDAGDLHTSVGWEWALITDIRDRQRTDGEIALPDNWTACNEREEARAGFTVVTSLQQVDVRSRWARNCHFIIELADPSPVGNELSYLFVCHHPEHTEHGSGMWAFHLRPFFDFRTAQVKSERLAIGTHARVLVRAIPIPRLLIASLSETPAAIAIVFRSLAGDQVGEATRSKDEGRFLMEDLVGLAEQVAEKENLRTSVNQKLCVLLEGCHHQLPPTAVLWSAATNQERGLQHL